MANFHQYLLTAELIEAQLRRELSVIGLPMKQARVLDAIGRLAPTTQVALSNEFHIAPASMSTMIDRLISQGYITRDIDPAELRRNVIKLTAKGSAVIPDIHAAWERVDAWLETTLDGDEAASLWTLTSSLYESLNT